MRTSSTRPNAAYEIRLARGDELRSLPDLEREACRRFETIPELAHVPEIVTPLDALIAAHVAGRVWVAIAERQPVGFAYAAVVDACCHLEELDVLSTFGRRGIGAALVRTIVAYAEHEGFETVTLTTFRDVPWNLPFYRRLGFEVVAPARWSPGVARLMREEAGRGLPANLRVVMALRCGRRRTPQPS